MELDIQTILSVVSYTILAPAAAWLARTFIHMRQRLTDLETTRLTETEVQTMIKHNAELLSFKDVANAEALESQKERLDRIEEKLDRLLDKLI